MPANQHFDHVGDTAVLARGRLTDGVLEGRVDAQIER